MFRTLIEERMRDRQVFMLDRTPPEQEKRDLYKSLIIEHVTASLTRQLEAMGGGIEQPQPLDPERTFGGLGTATQLQRHVNELLRNELGLPPGGLGGGTMPIFTGDLIFSPPYADDWQQGGGFAFLAIHDGSVITYGFPGFSAAGINLYLSSNTPELVSASITPVGTYKYSWTSFEDLPSLQTRGGLGVAVYLGDQQVMSREAVLWSQIGAPLLSGQTGEGQIADAASPAFGFGPVPIGPVLLNMTPGNQYLFTVWCWQVAQYPDNAAFLAILQMKMPSVKMRLGEPVVVH